MKSLLLHAAQQILLLSFVLNAEQGRSQNDVMAPVSPDVNVSKPPMNVGFGAETYVNGDSHGTFYSAGIHLEKGNSTFYLSTCMQKRSQELNGGKIGFSYLLSGHTDTDDTEEPEPDPRLKEDLELHLLCNLQYTHKAKLSYRASKVETITSLENTVNYNEVRFSTITATIGPELDFYLKRIKFRTYAGAFYIPECSANVGMAFINGGAGGQYDFWLPGGFGGGGSGWDGNGNGGGGGGYSGGGTSGASFAAGGGAGSYNGGTNQVNISGVNSGDGQVIITQIISTDIAESANNYNVNLYPNPNNGSFKVELPAETNAIITVSNILGQVIFSKTAEMMNSIELTDINSGVYHLSVSVNGTIVCNKPFVKQ